MKKSKKNLTFASSVLAAGALIGLTGCPNPSVSLYGNPEDPQPDVYGPPVINEEDYDDPGVEVYGPPEDFNVDVPSEPVYGPPPDDITDPIVTVYGPPEDFTYDDSTRSDNETDNADESREAGDDEKNPEDDLEEPMVVVYGPPEP